tara:strand:+ start:117 stop:746 length:630 start_codon:yes stop_codon:yes gene_type:complete
MTFALVKHNNNSISAITTPGSLAQGKMTLIKEQTASSSSSISFVDGSSSVVLDSTYPIYLFKFINLHVDTDTAKMQFNFSTDSGSNYNVTKTTTVFRATQQENGTNGQVGYNTGNDQAQSTSFHVLNMGEMDSQSDRSSSGEMLLFQPSSTTFVKHFISRLNNAADASGTFESYISGYGNTTSAIDAVQFKANSGTFDGTIKLYGIKGS